MEQPSDADSDSFVQWMYAAHARSGRKLTRPALCPLAGPGPRPWLPGCFGAAEPSANGAGRPSPPLPRPCAIADREPVRCPCTARRQGRAQPAPAARKKKKPVRDAEDAEDTEDASFLLRADGDAGGGASGGADGADAKTGGGRAARRRAALRRSSQGGAEEDGDDDEPARKPKKAPQAAQVQKRQRAVTAQQADKIRKLSGR